MKPNTALCLFLLAVAALVRKQSLDSSNGHLRDIAGDVAAGLTFGVSGLSLLEYLTRSSMGIDQLLITVPLDRFGDPAGRMSVSTALCLVLTSLAFLLLDRLPRLSTAFILLAMPLPVTGLVNFMFQAGPLQYIPWFRSLAVHTALSLLLLQLAALTLRPGREPWWSLTQRWAVEHRRRYLLPAVTVAPVLLALPIVWGLRLQRYDAPFALALLIVLLLAIQTFILWRDSISMGQAEAKFRDSEQRASRILQSIGDAVIVIDLDGCVTRMNAVAEDLTGWTEREAQSQPLAEVFRIVNQETRAEVESPVAKVQRTGTVCGLANHTILVRKNGSEIHIDDSGAPIRDSQGEMVGIVLVFRDIGERRASEKALQASESRLKSFVDSIPTLAWMANKDGYIFWYNRRWYEYTGTTEEQMKGWGWQSVHDPQMLPSVLERWTGSIRTGKPFEMIFPLRGADGVFRSFITRVVSVQSETGEVTGWFGTNTEVDELQRTREELREKTELIDLAQSAVNAGYWSYSPTTGECFLSLGEQMLFGFQDNARPSVGEVIERIHEADREHVVMALEKGMESGTYFAQFRIYKEDGALHWIAAQGRVLTKEDGQKYMVGINFNVTNQKLSEEALRKSEKLAVAGRLAATIAHEINNPLESVTNLLYILKTNITDGESLELLSTAEEELGRVSQIATQSLRFHRQSTSPSYEKASTILDSAVGIYNSRLKAEDVKIERDYRDHLPIRCYASELRQVFGNFIGNAFDAIRQGGTICLRTRETVHPITGEPGIRVTVADTGHGMDAKTLLRISEPFFTTKGMNGTGLGLWISRDILKKHHGILRVKSRYGTVFTGTVFSVFLPIAAVEELTSSE